ncbi:MAG TPA: exosortase H-associated membrane protein, partial [Casimicrobiaceae bacterium]|nr:exosortase H-associated membrane protein [Casimicrobiaceae bacterium]
MPPGRPVARFIGRIFAWLPLAFTVWYFAAPILLWPVRLAVDVIAQLGFADIVRAVEQHGSDVTFVTSLRPGEARAASGTVTVDVNLLVYSFGLPLYAALVLAVRERGWPQRLAWGF